MQSLEWTVNAYTLTFAVLLLTGAALGDRLGRRRIFAVRLTIFTAASAGAAVSASTDALIAARAVQGLGAAIVLPAHAHTALRGRSARPPWDGARHLGRGERPRRGDRTARRRRRDQRYLLALDLLDQRARRARPGSAGSHQTHRITRPKRPAGPAGPGAGGTGPAGRHLRDDPWSGAGLDERDDPDLVHRRDRIRDRVRGLGVASPAPMLPMRFFRSRAFAATNGLSFAMYFGVFGSIFLLAQFFQTTQGYSPLQAGLRTLPWTGMPMIIAPIAGMLSDRIGPRPLMVAGLALQATAIAWLAAILTPDIAYGRLIVPFMLAGAGMALVFAPSANAVLGSVRPQEAGQASGATNATRELGGVIGVGRTGLGVQRPRLVHLPARVHGRPHRGAADRRGRSRHRRGHRPGREVRSRAQSPGMHDLALPSAGRLGMQAPGMLGDVVGVKRGPGCGRIGRLRMER